MHKFLNFDEYCYASFDSLLKGKKELLVCLNWKWVTHIFTFIWYAWSFLLANLHFSVAQFFFFVKWYWWMLENCCKFSSMWFECGRWLYKVYSGSQIFWPKSWEPCSEFCLEGSILWWSITFLNDSNNINFYWHY